MDYKVLEKTVKSDPNTIDIEYLSMPDRMKILQEIEAYKQKK